MLPLSLTVTILCNVALAAHFLREGSLVPVLVCLLGTALLLTRKRWALTVNQVLLAFGALVWLGTAGEILERRLAEGKPYVRMVIIMTSVAGLALLSAGLLAVPKVRARFARPSF